MRTRLTVTGAVVLAAALLAFVLWPSDTEDPPADVTVTWGGTEGHPSCVYDPDTEIVEATLTVDGTASEPHTLTITITAYADENTSRPVGSSTRTVEVEGTTHTTVVVTVHVDRAPHVDVDGETACSLSVED